MRNRRSIDVLAVAVCLAACVFAALSIWLLPPRVESVVYSEVGRTLATAALDVLPKGGNGRVVVIARDTQTYRQPAMDITMSEFEKIVTKAGIPISKRLVQIDPLRPVEIPPGDFYEAIRRANTNDVIVSFLGPPILDIDQQAKLTGPKPRIVALCTGAMAEAANLGDLAARGLLQAAIVNRTSTTAATNKTGGNLTFDQLYALVRAEELSRPNTGR